MWILLFGQNSAKVNQILEFTTKALITILRLKFLNTLATIVKKTIPGILGGEQSSLGIQQPPCSSKSPQPICVAHSPEQQKEKWR